MSSLHPEIARRHHGFDREDGSCLECDGHAVQRLNAKTQQPFHGCSNFPRCRNVQSMGYSRGGSLLLSPDDLDEAFYEAFYEGDGR